MSGSKKGDARDKELRARAEAALASEKATQDGEGESSGSRDALLHDLHIHQAELEMQNEELRVAQAALEVSRERYFDLYDLAPVGYCTVSATGLILETNLTLAKMLNTGRAQLPGNALFRFITPDDRGAFARFSNLMLAEPGTNSLEVRLASKGGGTLWVNLSASAGRDGEGTTEYRVVFADISLQKEQELARSVAEAELGDTARHLSAHMDNTPLAIIEFDPSFQILRWSRGAERLFGWPQEEVLGRMISDFRWTHEDKDEAIPWEVSKFLSGEFTNSPSVIRSSCKDGSVVFCAWYNSAISDSEGRLITVQSLVLDITEARAKDIKLRESEQFLLGALNGLSAHVAILDQEGDILMVNDAWRQFASENGGIENKTGQGVNYFSVCDDLVGVDAHDGEAFSAGIRAVMEGEQVRFSMEYPCHTPDESRWFIGRVTRFPGDGPSRVIVAHENITERKFATEKLKESRDFRQSLIDSMLDGFAVLYPSGIHIEVNPALCRITGYSREELIGKGLPYPYWEPKLQGSIDKAYRRALSGVERAFEVEFRSKGGEQVLVMVSPSVIQDEEGTVQFCLVIVKDITNRARAEIALTRSKQELRELLAELDRAASNERRRIADYMHDEIVQNLALAKRRTGNVSVADDASTDELHAIGASISMVIDQLRDLSIELSSPVLEQLGLDTALESLADDYTRQFSLDVQYTKTGTFDKALRDEASLLYRAARELLLNVVKHAHARHVWIRLVVDSDGMLLSVKDDGQGVHVDSVYSVDIPGNGYGLLSLKERFRYLGGSLEFVSEFGEGVEVTLRLPLPDCSS